MEIVITILGTVTAVITICLTNYFNKRNKLRFEERKLKEKYYLKFIEALSDNVLFTDKEAALDSHAYARNRLILVANTEVIHRLLEYEDAVSIIKRNGDSPEASKHHDETLTELVKAMRTELFGTSAKVNVNYPLIAIIGRNKRSY